MRWRRLTTLQLPYPVLSDAKKEATKAYGVSKGLMGLAPGRVTFLIDKQGKIVSSKTGVLNYAGHNAFARDEVAKMRGKVAA